MRCGAQSSVFGSWQRFRPSNAPTLRPSKRRYERSAQGGGAVSSLAFRAGAPKSVLTQWLKNEEWRLNFEQLLDICAVEEVDLVELLPGRVVPSPGAAGLVPPRVRRGRDPVDHEAIRSALALAFTEERSVTDVARALRVDLATLVKHRDLYVPVREATARRNAAAEEARHLAAIQEVETMASNLAERGKRLPHRNALREGANRFALSSVESVVLSVMRTALGGRKAKGSAVAARLSQRYLQRISEAADRLRTELGAAQIPLLLQGDWSPTWRQARGNLPLRADALSGFVIGSGPAA